jgi:hypothetical protein
MATVNYNSKSYEVDTGVNRNGVKFDGAKIKREFKLMAWGFRFENEEGTWVQYADGRFSEVDTEDITGYESKPENNIPVSIPFNNAWVTTGKLDLKLVKVALLNAAFKEKFNVEPLNDSGTVKAEFI